jgi:hypothetical protein
MMLARGISLQSYNAIAHAEKEVFVNPDRTIDYQRIEKDLPIISALARYAIQERFNLLPCGWFHDPTSMVGAFESRFDKDLLEKIANRQPNEGGNVNFPDSVSIVARRNANVFAFLNMRCEQLVEVHQKQLDALQALKQELEAKATGETRQD